MLEITLLHAKADGGAATMTAFQFENDALQSFLTEAQANETGVAFASIRALGVPLTVTADMPARKAKAKAEAKESDNPRAKVNQPIAREPVNRASIDESQPTARTQQQPAKPSTERK